MPLFRGKPSKLPLRMPRMDSSSWPDRRDVEWCSFAALTLYEMGYREAFEPEAATIADRLVVQPDERSIEREVGRALWAAVSELPAMPPEQRRIARYLLQAGHYVARTGFGTIPRLVASLADDDPCGNEGNRR